MKKKEMTREQMIALIASDYGFGPETTNKLKTEILSAVCDSHQPYIYLNSLLALANPDVYLEAE